MSGRSRYLKGAALAAVAVMTLCTVLLVSMDSGSEWTTNVLEEAIIVHRDPDHTKGEAPLNGQPMRIVIESRTDQTINAADLSFTWSYGGKQSAPGGYQFTRINQTAMEAQIPGYPGGTAIQYWIIAYDEKNHPLTSTTYAYTVVSNGSWKGTDFESNLLLQWEPKAPKNGQGVNLTLTSKDPEVPIQRGDLIYTVNIPDYEPQIGASYFESVNSTVMRAHIISYPPGSKVSFHVDAYDTYRNKITSKDVLYEYPVPPPVGPIYTGYLFILLKDIAGNGPADGAEVTFSNETFSHKTSSAQGIAFTNRTVYQGAYKVEVNYKGKDYTFNVNVPRPDGSFTFQFEVNKKMYVVDLAEQQRPGWREALGLVLLIMILGGLIYGAMKVGNVRLALNERKKKARRRTEELKISYLEGLLLDEERKNLIVRTGAFLLLSLLGLTFAPFYPWWMVLLLIPFITAISMKYPYISLLVLSVIATAAVAYQSREFGWVFLVFSLIVMIGGFFDWRYAYLTMLTVFAAGSGFGFAVPMVAALAFSLFMGTVVLLTAGAFLLVVAPSGNFSWLSFISSEEGGRSFVTFSRKPNPGWAPVDAFNNISGLTNVDIDTLSKVLSDTMGSMIPLFGLLGWGAAMLAAYFVFKRWDGGRIVLDKDFKKWLLRAIPGAIVAVFGIVSLVWAGTPFTFWTVVAILGCIPASMVAFAVRAFGEEAMPLEYGVVEIKSSDVGKKISEMVGFRKATFDDIGGLEDVKREVKNALMVPLLEPEMATKYGVKPSKGILLFGPPGCGKTLMLRAVASDLNVDMIGIKCSDVMSKWYGESENLIASLFEEARARSPCILFLDEIDAIAKRRDFYSTDDVTPRVLSIMLSEMDGMDEAEGIIVVGTTNMPDLVDPALMRPGRFDKVIYIPPPDRTSREEIVKIHLKGKFTSKDIDVKGIAAGTEGFSGADLANLVREASSLGLERALETRKPQPITMADLLQVLEEIKPSVTPKMFKMYDKLRHEYERKRRGPAPKKEAPPQGDLKTSTLEDPPKKKKGPKATMDEEENIEELKDDEGEN